VQSRGSPPRRRIDEELQAYGPAPGLEHLDTFVRARGVQVLAWSLLTAAHASGPRERTARRLHWLHAQSQTS
jgi:hypothetical protein